MSGLVYKGIMWATMLGSISEVDSCTWWLTREESWPEALFGGKECETEDMLATT